MNNINTRDKINILLLCIILSVFIKVKLFSAEVVVAPNPWIPESQKVATGNFTDGLSFINLPSEGEILIYSVTGGLVKRIVFSGNTSGKQIWLGRNEDDEYAASGIYIWILKSPGSVKSGKIIIIR